MTAVDWSRYRKCPACAAAVGEPCRLVLAVVPGQEPTYTSASQPHGHRRLRTGGASMPKQARETTIAEIEAQFELASYWMGIKWCPAVARKDDGGYSIRTVKGRHTYPGGENVSYDYFELDADGVVTTAPRGHAKTYRPGRVVDIADAARILAEDEVAQAAAPRYQVGGW